MQKLTMTLTKHNIPVECDITLGTEEVDMILEL